MPEQKLSGIVKHYTTWIPVILHYCVIIVITLLIVGVIAVVLKFALRIWDWRQLLRQKYVFLEITPPASADKSPLQSTEFVKRMHGIGSQRDVSERLQRLHFSLSLELPSSFQDGTRYLVRVPEQEADLTKQVITEQLDKAHVRIVNDYLPHDLDYKSAQVLDFKLGGAYYLPLNKQLSFKAHDPFIHLANAMTGLSENEQVVLQLIVKPARFKHAEIIRQRVKSNEDMLALSRKNNRGTIFKMTFGIVFKLVSEVVMFITDVIYSTPSYSQSSNMNTHEHLVSKGVKPAREITPAEQALNDSIHEKVTQKLFRVEVRALVVSDDKEQAKKRVKAMKAAMQAYDTEHQQLRAQWNFPAFILGRYRLFKFTHRLPSLFQHHSNKLDASEIANIYHFPVPGTSTGNLVKSRSSTLPATLSQKRSSNFDVIVGRNVYQEQYTDIGLTAETRMKHMYVIGATGTGKTTMLKNMIYQDMMSGKGLAVLEPHGDMFRELLQIVPKHRRKDVVVFDPYDREFPPGLNLLDPGVEFADEDDKHEWITSMVLSVFERLTDEKLWGPRMEHNLRNATLTALQLPNPSLYTIQRLLTEKSFQREAAKQLKDPVLKQFWDKEFKLLGTMQLAKETKPLTHRLGHFITAKMSRHILLQEKSTMRIADIMNEGKILLVNLSKGDIGEDQSFFFGTVLTSLIWMAAYQRTKIPESKRRDFYLYVDEFQNFATKQFTDITSEGRKFHISLIASHQNIAQVEDKNILKIIAGNAHVITSLKTGPEDEAFILPFMEPEVSKGDIVNLNPYHFYMKTTTGESENAFSGETVPLNVGGSDEVAQEVIDNSRRQYGTPKHIVEEYLERLLSEPDKKTRRKKSDKEDNDTDDSTDSPTKEHGA